MLDSRPFGTLQVVGAAQGQVPLWGRSDVPLPRPPARSLGTARIGWHSASRLSITECKQGADWLLSSPHRAS